MGVGGGGGGGGREGRVRERRGGSHHVAPEEVGVWQQLLAVDLVCCPGPAKEHLAGSRPQGLLRLLLGGSSCVRTKRKEDIRTPPCTVTSERHRISFIGLGPVEDGSNARFRTKASVTCSEEAGTLQTNHWKERAQQMDMRRQNQQIPFRKARQNTRSACPWD